MVKETERGIISIIPRVKKKRKINPTNKPGPKPRAVPHYRRSFYGTREEMQALREYLKAIRSKAAEYSSAQA